MSPMNRPGGIKKGRILLLGGAGVTVILLILLAVGGFGMNNVQDWQVMQSVLGEITIIDAPGWYLKKFGTTWTYSRAIQKEYVGDARTDDDGIVSNAGDSIRATFNDGGESWHSTMIRFATPKTAEKRLLAHRQFSGNQSNMADSVRAHMVNCLKATAPLMSSSEHQSARKAEFRQITEDMMRDGIYRMRKITKILKDETDTEGTPITIFATEIITDKDGNAIIAQVSPLKMYGFEILQFSITSTAYDKKTREKFAAKKDAFLRAEQAKADRENEVQQRLMVIEKGKRELAEVEAAANMEKKTAVVNADREAEVAEIQAAQLVAVAIQAKLEAQTKAQRQVEVAKLLEEEQTILARAAAKEAEAIRILASAKEEQIIRGGAVTEKDRVLAEIAADRDVRVAEMLASIEVPRTLIVGGSNGQGDGQGVMMQQLINLALLKNTGIIEDNRRSVKIPIGPANVEVSPK